MKYGLSIVLGLLLLGTTAFSQGRVRVMQDPGIEKLVQKRLELNRKDNTISGYRVQIYYGSERSEAQAAKERFELLYPGQEAYLIYQPPYFKVRAGDFRSRIEAYPVYHHLNKEFESAFIVEEDIQFPKLGN